MTRSSHEENQADYARRKEHCDADIIDEIDRFFRQELVEYRDNAGEHIIAEMYHDTRPHRAGDYNKIANADADDKRERGLDEVAVHHAEQGGRDENCKPVAELARGHHDHAAQRIFLNERRHYGELDKIHRNAEWRRRGARIGIFKCYTGRALDKGRKKIRRVVAYHADHQTRGHSKKHETRVIGLAEVQALLTLIFEQQARQEERDEYAENRHQHAYRIAAIGLVRVVVIEIESKQQSRADELEQGEQ